MATQGSSGTAFPFYVESFQFKYSNSSLEWTEYSENGIPKVNQKGVGRSKTETVRSESAG